MLFGGCRVLGGAPDVEYARSYPRATPSGDVLDIQVFRSGTKLTMTNSTSRSFGPSTLWVNERFSRPIDGFEPGETLTLDLYEFRDQYQDQFRAGGFFATRDPDPVVLVQLETGPEDASDEMIGFVIVSDDIN
jgi:hypothetical protein